MRLRAKLPILVAERSLVSAEFSGNHPTWDWALAWLFAITYPQAPLFSENQNTKFLHGAADAGFGFLKADWTASTTDPFPLFSLLIQLIYLFAPIQIVYGVFIALSALYAHSLIGICRRIFRTQLDTNQSAVYLAWSLLFLTHHTYLATHLVEGFAFQYLLGHYLQPCVAGVFILVSIRNYLDNQVTKAISLLVIPMLIHPGAYAFSTVLLAISYALFRPTRDPGKSIRLGLLTVIISGLLLAVYYWFRFELHHTKESIQAIDILSNERIPHHTQVDKWLDWTSAIKMALIVLAGLIVFGIRDRIIVVFFAMAGFVALATAALHASPNDTVAFATPWRVSVILVPLSTMILATKLSLKTAPVVLGHAKRKMGLAALVFLGIGYAAWSGVTDTYFRYQHYRMASSMPMINFGRANANPGQIYLLPPRLSNLERFRLETGVPILANWKTHPYRADEVLEWRQRITDADNFYNALTPSRSIRLLFDLAEKYGITHVVMYKGIMLKHAGIELVYDDEHYQVYRINARNRQADT
jgi:hypothetical protein